MAFAIVFLATAGLGLLARGQVAAINFEAADVRNNWLPSTGVDDFTAAIDDVIEHAERTTPA